MSVVNNHQREGFSSNSAAGADFERIAHEYFRNKENVTLQKNYELKIGVELQKEHRFDLGSDEILVECKSHTWTNGNNAPSAKMSVWNEAMFYFNLAPKEYKKILFVLRDYNQNKRKTLVQYYISNYYHFIPKDVLFYEYSDDGNCEIYDFEKWRSLI